MVRRGGDDFGVGLGNAERHDFRSRYLVRESSCVAEISRSRRIEKHDVGAQLTGLRRRLQRVGRADDADASLVSEQRGERILADTGR